MSLWDQIFGASPPTGQVPAVSLSPGGDPWSSLMARSADRQRQDASDRLDRILSSAQGQGSNGQWDSAVALLSGPDADDAAMGSGRQGDLAQARLSASAQRQQAQAAAALAAAQQDCSDRGGNWNDETTGSSTRYCDLGEVLKQKAWEAEFARQKAYEEFKLSIEQRQPINPVIRLLSLPMRMFGGRF